MAALTSSGVLSPVIEQLFEERVAIHRNLEEWRRLAHRRKGSAAAEPRHRGLSRRLTTCAASTNRRQ